MDSREYISTLSRSPLGLVMAVVAVTVGVMATLSLGIGLGLGIGAASLAAMFSAATLTGLGPKAAAAERERRDWAAARRYLDAAKASRDRLSTFRVPDTEVKFLLELVAARGSGYIAAALAARSRDPRAEEALADCVSIADIYIKELDGASTERRYGLEDADPFAEAKERVIAALRDKAALVEMAAKDLSGGLSPADSMEIKESL